MAWWNLTNSLMNIWQFWELQLNCEMPGCGQYIGHSLQTKWDVKSNTAGQGLSKGPLSQDLRSGYTSRRIKTENGSCKLKLNCKIPRLGHWYIKISATELNHKMPGIGQWDIRINKISQVMKTSVSSEYSIKPGFKVKVQIGEYQN